MKQKILVKISLTIGLSLIFVGCGSGLNPQINSLNNSLEKKHAPDRYYKTKSTKHADTYTNEWTGEKGKSVAFTSKVVTADVFKLIKKHCGLKKSDLIETRIVSYKDPTYYEVWVFKDSLSERKDKTSALTVILTQYSNTSGVDIAINGQCHSKPLTFTFGK